MSDSGLLRQAPGAGPEKARAEIALRHRLVARARGELGVRELTGRNDGPRVESYLAYTNLPKGYAWCACFISWVFAQEGLKQPRTAWSPALFPAARLTRELKPAQLIGIYHPAKKRIAHVGMVEEIRGDWCLSIEGNTSPDGSFEGNGVYRRKRHVKTLKYVADWLK